MAGRPKKLTRELVLAADADMAMFNLLRQTVELEKLKGQLDLARAEATSRFEKAIDARKTEIADIEAQLQQWFLVHACPLPGYKSVTLHCGVIGQRTGQPVLKPLNRSWSWKAIVIKLHSLYGAKFFHPARDPEPHKDLIRAELNEEQLKNVGLKVEQEERFYVELDRTSLGEANGA